MRISNVQKEFLKQCMQKIDTDARMFLFGSRIDEHQRGGDIDLLLFSKKMKRTDLWKIRQPFCEKFGEQKIDIVLSSPDAERSAFVQHILFQAIEL
ncbi:MAG: nucleotidyltransferase domain-containing protein [SAR324 cluster bacterium]|nr:nucleotidyltransferase domain-containing protein [SAR324 cluster bacterium]